MSFQEQARQAMRNGGSDDMRRRELLSAVEWNCSRLKAAILNQISRGEHSGSGEPFLRAVFSSSKTNEFVREKRFSRGMRSLSAHVRTDERLFGAQRYGERAALLLSVDYVCTVR